MNVGGGSTILGDVVCMGLLLKGGGKCFKRE